MSAQYPLFLCPKEPHAVHNYLWEAQFGVSVTAELRVLSSTCSLFRHWMERKSPHPVLWNGVCKGPLDQIRTDWKTHTQASICVTQQWPERMLFLWYKQGLSLLWVEYGPQSTQTQIISGYLAHFYILSNARIRFYLPVGVSPQCGYPFEKV